jgi:uncharacterized protein
MKLIRWLSGCIAVLLAMQVHAAPDAYREFFEAIKKNEARDVRTWLVRGINPNASDPQLGPALVAAAKTRSYEALKVLLESPETKVNATNKLGETALMLAAMHGELDAVKRLVAKGAEVNKTDWTPLHYAATGGNLEITQFLIEQNAYIDAQSPNKTTPLMMAARHRNATVARYLVEEGADPTQRNDAGFTAADYFQRYGENDLAKWLRDQAREFEGKYGTIAAPKRRPESGN